jgi:hypothetical protein
MKRLLFCSVLLISCACSDSTPTVDQAKASIEAQLARFGKMQGLIPGFTVPNGITVARIHKTDGQVSEVFGVKQYNIFYEGELEFAKDGRVYPGNQFILYYIPPNTPINRAIYDQMRVVRKGQREKFTGSMQFYKDGEWLAAGGRRYFERGIESHSDQHRITPLPPIPPIDGAIGPMVVFSCLEVCSWGRIRYGR